MKIRGKAKKGGGPTRKPVLLSVKADLKFTKIRFVSCERKIIGLSCIGKGVQRQEGVDSEQKRAYSNIVSPDQAYVIHEDDDDQRCRCRSLH
ncbi:uncharacterized protein LOC132266949 isoform X2 [Cornus florida]|uniref:uncharacterized protein LOC132266949 isoform X2 n=1 Tax=Cornus florida TaxID=4283 RepID=UPI002897170B|nr:uncharacterized protein LOC132266949 isoform X2 [Cornus florida]